MKTIVLLLLAFLPATHALAADALRLVVSLKDGSRIVGQVPSNAAPVTVRSAVMGELKLPLANVRAIQFDADKANITLQNGDRLQGVLAQDAFKLATLVGNVSLPVIHITRLEVTGPVAMGPQIEGLVLWYAFDADEGDRVTDKSGLDHHGRVRAAKYVAGGKAGGAMQFGEANTGIVVGNPADLQLQDLTIAAWIKTDSLEQPSPDNPSMAALFVLCTSCASSACASRATRSSGSSGVSQGTVTMKGVSQRSSPVRKPASGPA